MKLYKIISGILISTVEILTWYIIIYAILEHEIVIALLCPILFELLKGMWHLDVVKGGKKK